MARWNWRVFALVAVLVGMLVGGTVWTMSSRDEPVQVATAPSDPISAIDIAMQDLGHTVDRAQDVDWRPECSPTDEVLGYQLVATTTMPAGVTVPSDWIETGSGGHWTTPEGAEVHHFDEGMMTVSAPASLEYIRSSSRVVDEPTHVCG